MTSFWSWLKSLFVDDAETQPVAAGQRVEPVVGAGGAPAAAVEPEGGLRFPADDADSGDAAAREARWQAAYQARQAWFEREFGAFPGDILKLRNLAGVWPGGGLFALPADRVEPGLWLYTTFGLSNPDMPATIVATPADEGAFRLEAKPAAAVVAPPAGAAGYGYEFAVLARDSVEWPLRVLQWAANAELLQDVNILDRVEKNDGLTVQDIAVSNERGANLLIAKARPPLPNGTVLPNGGMALLVGTVITDDEMQWALQHGRGALLERLLADGVGQVSVLDRASVV